VQGVDVYQQNSHDELSLDKMVTEYRPLVKKIALYIKRRLPSHVELEDLLQSGFVGLIEAKNHYRPNMGATFETYASIRIRGAMIDALRRNSWGNRETTKNLRMITEAINTVEQRTHQHATNDEVAKELGISIDEYTRISQQISVSQILSIDALNLPDIFPNETEDNPQEISQAEEMKEHIKALINRLPEREQLVLTLYYVEEFTFKQIGEILDLTEARVCQLHSKAITKIQVKLRYDHNS
jgi:RNA polymerase sigma factor for flagellar operon FliA